MNKINNNMKLKMAEYGGDYKSIYYSYQIALFIKQEAYLWKIFTFHRCTWEECISDSFWRATTHWYVIVHLADCTLSTKVDAWIYTFVSGTCQVRSTVWAMGTFGSTTEIWIAKVVRLACAHAIVTFRIGSTRTRITFVVNIWNFFCKYKQNN